MQKKIIINLQIIFLIIIGIIVFTSKSSSKVVMTVDQIVDEGKDQSRIRLGARVVDNNIIIESEPPKVKFRVADIASSVAGNSTKSFLVTYKGHAPNTLMAGRDVILEGDYFNGEFVAESLMTQCPSKYEPPVPGKQ